MYFDIIKSNKNIIFKFNVIIIDILWDYSNKYIPFSKKLYYNYQDLVILIIDLVNIHTSIQVLVEQKNISIILSNLSEENIVFISQIITNYIDSKFTILN